MWWQKVSKPRPTKNCLTCKDWSKKLDNCTNEQFLDCVNGEYEGGARVSIPSSFWCKHHKKETV